jgi:hypothetical protein
MGGSCVWDFGGDSVSVSVLGSGECDRLPKGTSVGITSLNFERGVPQSPPSVFDMNQN